MLTLADQYNPMLWPYAWARNKLLGWNYDYINEATHTYVSKNDARRQMILDGGLGMVNPMMAFGSVKLPGGRFPVHPRIADLELTTSGPYAQSVEVVQELIERGRLGDLNGVGRNLERMMIMDAAVVMSRPSSIAEAIGKSFSEYAKRIGASKTDLLNAVGKTIENNIPYHQSHSTARLAAGKLSDLDAIITSTRPCGVCYHRAGFGAQVIDAMPDWEARMAMYVFRGEEGIGAHFVTFAVHADDLNNIWLLDQYATVTMLDTLGEMSWIDDIVDLGYWSKTLKNYTRFK